MTTPVSYKIAAIEREEIGRGKINWASYITGCRRNHRTLTGLKKFVDDVIAGRENCGLWENGKNTISTAAAALGRKGGSVSSPAKTAAARANAKLPRVRAVVRKISIGK